jgi:hypothetical protein
MITWCFLILLDFIDIQRKPKYKNHSVNLNEIKKIYLKKGKKKNTQDIIILLNSILLNKIRDYFINQKN